MSERNQMLLDIAQLRADLAAAIAGGADIVAQRDTALGLCKQREKELAAVTDGLHKSMDRVTTLAALLLTERLDHAETRKALDAWTQNGFGAQTPAEVQVFIEEGCRVEREVAEHNAKLLESTRAELAKAEARVKELGSTVAAAAREMLRYGLKLEWTEESSG